MKIAGMKTAATKLAAIKIVAVKLVAMRLVVTKLGVIRIPLRLEQPILSPAASAKNIPLGPPPSPPLSRPSKSLGASWPWLSCW
jgi:hypothetical protein